MKCTCKNGRKEIKVCVGVADILMVIFLEQYVKNVYSAIIPVSGISDLRETSDSWEFPLSSKVRLYNVKKVGKKYF